MSAHFDACPGEWHSWAGEECKHQQTTRALLQVSPFVDAYTVCDACRLVERSVVVKQDDGCLRDDQRPSPRCSGRDRYVAPQQWRPKPASRRATRLHSCRRHPQNWSGSRRYCRLLPQTIQLFYDKSADTVDVWSAVISPVIRWWIVHSTYYL